MTSRGNTVKANPNFNYPGEKTRQDQKYRDFFAMNNNCAAMCKQGEFSKNSMLLLYKLSHIQKCLLTAYKKLWCLHLLAGMSDSKNPDLYYWVFQTWVVILKLHDYDTNIWRQGFNQRPVIGLGDLENNSICSELCYTQQYLGHFCTYFRLKLAFVRTWFPQAVRGKGISNQFPFGYMIAKCV